MVNTMDVYSWLKLKNYYREHSKLVKHNEEAEFYYYIHSNRDEVLRLLQNMLNIKYERESKEIKEKDYFAVIADVRGY